jgi:uncharacterized membrane protein YgcG
LEDIVLKATPFVARTAYLVGVFLPVSTSILVAPAATAQTPHNAPAKVHLTATSPLTRTAVTAKNASPIPSAGDRIKSMKLDAVVQRDGSLEVREDLHLSFKSHDRHGITRCFANVYHLNGFRYPVKVSIYSVSDKTGKPADFEVVQDPGQTNVNIGNHGKLLDGEQYFTLRYRLTGLVTEHDGAPKFVYWHATGKWPFPIDAAEVALHTPPGSTAGKASCHVQGANKDLVVSSDGPRIDCPTTALSPGSALVIGADLDAKSVELSRSALTNNKPNLAANSKGWLKQYPYMIFLGLGLVLLLAKMALTCNCRCGLVCQCNCTCGTNCRCTSSGFDPLSSPGWRNTSRNYGAYYLPPSGLGQSSGWSSTDSGSSWSDTSSGNSLDSGGGSFDGGGSDDSSSGGSSW